jgi:hypothetical protein
VVGERDVTGEARWVRASMSIEDEDPEALLERVGIQHSVDFSDLPGQLEVVGELLEGNFDGTLSVRTADGPDCEPAAPDDPDPDRMNCGGADFVDAWVASFSD